MMERSEVQQNDTLCSRRSRYLIMEFTGEGGFGKVARAVDLITSQDVALKILKKETPSEREVDHVINFNYELNEMLIP